MKQERTWAEEAAGRRLVEALKASTEQPMALIGLWNTAIGIAVADRIA